MLPAVVVAIRQLAEAAIKIQQLSGIVYANRSFILNTLLLSGYIPPSSEAIHFLFGVFACSVLAGLLVLWGGVQLIKRDKWIGFAVVLLAVALPAAGFRVLLGIL